MLALAIAAPASAGGNVEQIKITPAGQKAAQAALLTRADLSTSVKWTRSAYKPDVAGSQIGCPGFHPKVSDLVLVGAAGAFYTSKISPALQINSLIEVLKTTHMVGLDWQRTSASPLLITCLAEQATAFFSQARFVSIHPLALPHMGAHSGAWRSEFALTSGAKQHFIYDLVIATRGRTEVSLTTTADIRAAAGSKATEARLVARLLARVRT